MRGLVLAALLATGAITLAHGDGEHKVKNAVPIRIVGAEEGKLWGQPVLPPLMSFRVRSGKAPEKGQVPLCYVVTDKKLVADYSFNTISLHCEDGLVMELEGIDLSGGGQ